MTIAFPADRTAWFRDARFGLFIHWGLYAVHGHGEWAMSREAIPWDEYERLLPGFTAEAYDPRAWTRLAKRAGMRYAVLTTKHHEGFCLWNSTLCAFNSMNSPAKRDLVREFVEAFRAEGLQVGLYYSLGDWRNPDWAKGWQGDEAAKARFMNWTHGLIRELMTGYGRIDVLWYDLPQCYGIEDWRSVELNAQVRALQPHILINNRAYTSEDFVTPEQHVGGGAKGRLTESCMTMNEHWGFNPHDHEWKSVHQLALQLASAASGGGNLLLNVGPDPRGAIPPEAVSRLDGVGRWLEKHRCAIDGSRSHGLPWLLAGPVTWTPPFLNVVLRHHYGERFDLGGLTNRVLSATCLSTGATLAVEQRRESPARVRLSGLPARWSQDDGPLVVRLEIEGKPDSDLSRVIGKADIFPVLPP